MILHVLLKSGVINLPINRVRADISERKVPLPNLPSFTFPSSSLEDSSAFQVNP